MPDADGNYIGLFCTESPDARFEDLVTVTMWSADRVLAIDPRFVSICEPHSIQAIGHIANELCLVCAEVVGGDKLHVKCDRPGAAGIKVVVKLSGVRSGRAKLRFPAFTKDEAQKNTLFWGQWQS